MRTRGSWKSTSKRVWAIYLEQPRAHRRSDVLERRITEISAELSRRNLPWDDWQILYRLLLQVDRALHGDEPLLRHAQRMEEKDMADEKVALPAPGKLEKAAGAAGAADGGAASRCKGCRTGSWSGT